MTDTESTVIAKVRQWERFADEDLRLARHALTLTSGCPHGLIAYHAQQCAEKYEALSQCLPVRRAKEGVVLVLPHIDADDQVLRRASNLGPNCTEELLSFDLSAHGVLLY